MDEEERGGEEERQREEERQGEEERNRAEERERDCCVLSERGRGIVVYYLTSCQTACSIVSGDIFDFKFAVCCCS